MRPPVRTFVIGLLTLGLLAFFLRHADMANVWAETRRADAGDLTLAVLVTGLTYGLRAWRWQALLAPIGPTHFGTAFRTTVIGFAANTLLPARAGEFLRPYLLAKREGLNVASAFATIILERLLDLATVLLLFALFVLTAQPSLGEGVSAHLAHIKFWGSLAAGGAIAGLGLLFAVAGHPERLGRAALRIEHVLPARLAHVAAGLVETFARGLAVMRSPGRLMAALALSFPMWMSIAAGIWLTSRAFHITLPYMGSFLVTTILVVGVAVPTPGAVGGFHAAYQFAASTFFGVPTDRAVGAALVLHAISFGPVTLLGIVFMMREGLTLTTARRIAAESRVTGEPRAEGALPAVPAKKGAR
jgi:uncharacterized protein (TIRG00374 family)